tara:strand:+ start:1060 stop:2049 length:990 start_codon:yes stop_codon:yes gene_type:complete
MIHPFIELIYKDVPSCDTSLYCHEKLSVNGIITCLINGDQAEFFSWVVNFEKNKFFSSCGRMYKTIRIFKIMKSASKKYKKKRIINNSTLVEFKEIPQGKIIPSSTIHPFGNRYVQLDDDCHTATLFDIYELQKVVVESLLQYDGASAEPKYPTNPYTKVLLSNRNLHKLFFSIHPSMIHPVMKQFEITGFRINETFKKNIRTAALRKNAESQTTSELFEYVRYAIVCVFSCDICLRCVKKKATRADILRMYMLVFQFANYMPASYKNENFEGTLATYLLECQIFTNSNCEHKCKKKFSLHKRGGLPMARSTGGIFQFGQSQVCHYPQL